MEREPIVLQSESTFFQDWYVILALAAHKTLAKKPVSSKIAVRLGSKLTQWVNSLLNVITRSCQRKLLSYTDSIWEEPNVLIRKILDKKCVKVAKVSGFKK